LHWVATSQQIGVLDGRQRSQSPDLDATSLLSNAFQFGDVANIEHKLRLEQLLPHGWD
jgi:hypothetical protein